MMHYIFRKSDQLYSGAVSPPHSVEVELDNLTKSELGGTPNGYTVVASQIAPIGTVPKLVDGAVRFVTVNAIPATRARESGNAKLLALGLTQEEIDARF